MTCLSKTDCTIIFHIPKCVHVVFFPTYLLDTCLGGLTERTCLYSMNEKPFITTYP